MAIKDPYDLLGWCLDHDDEEQDKVMILEAFCDKEVYSIETFLMVHTEYHYDMSNFQRKRTRPSCRLTTNDYCVE